MKISYIVPKGSKNVGTFIQKEIGSAKNIQDSTTRNSVDSGLRKIASAI